MNKLTEDYNISTYGNDSRDNKEGQKPLVCKLVMINGKPQLVMKIKENID